MNVLALIEAQASSQNETRLDRWVDDIAAAGDTVEARVVQASQSVLEINQIVVGSGADHVQKFGNVPVPKVLFGGDGHGDRPVSSDCVDCTAALDGWGWNASAQAFLGNECWPSSAVRSVARVYFDGMSNIGDPVALMDQWLDDNHAYRTGAFEYDNRACLVDTLDYLDPPLRALLAQSLADGIGGADRVIDMPFQASQDNTWFQAHAGKDFLLGALFAGGGNADAGIDGGIGEWYIGHEHDFASRLVKIAGVLLFCSFGEEWDRWPLQRALLVGGSQWVWWDLWDQGPLTGWDEQTPIGKIVQQSQVQNSQNVATLIGDGMLRRRFPVVSQSDFDALTQRVSAAEQAISQLQQPGTVIGAAVTVQLAVYRPAASTALGGVNTADATAAVQRLFSAGRAFAVHPDVTLAVGDPDVGVVKELYVKWVRGGATHEQVFTQTQPVIL